MGAVSECNLSSFGGTYYYDDRFFLGAFFLVAVRFFPRSCKRTLRFPRWRVYTASFPRRKAGMPAFAQEPRSEKKSATSDNLHGRFFSATKKKRRRKRQEGSGFDPDSFSVVAFTIAPGRSGAARQAAKRINALASSAEIGLAQFLRFAAPGAKSVFVDAVYG